MPYDVLANGEEDCAARIQAREGGREGGRGGKREKGGGGGGGKERERERERERDCSARALPADSGLSLLPSCV